MTFRISRMNDIPDWLWNQWNTPDWYWKGLAVWATGWVTGKTIEWAWQHRKELGEISNNLVYRLGERPRAITETVDALSLRAVSPQPQVRTATVYAQAGSVTGSARLSGASSLAASLEAVSKKPSTKREIYRIADTVLYYFT